MQYLSLILVALPVIVVLDLLWFAVSLQNLYRKAFGEMLADSVSLLPAALFYIIYAGAVAFFVVEPAIVRQSLWYALGAGALLGLAAYATYNFTNLAVMRDWPLITSVIDLCWGVVMTAGASGLTYLVATTLLGR